MMKDSSSILIELQYFPPVQYFSQFLNFDKVYIEQYENYCKGTYRNRCYIATSSGIQMLSIPLKKGKNEQQNIRKVGIAADNNWPRQHWRSIQTAYSKSPYFEFYADQLALLFTKPPEHLFEFNLTCLKTMLKLLGISTPIAFSAEFEKNPGKDILDFRNALHPKKHKNRADIHFDLPKYGQVFEERNGFLPNLSILDLLFCTGPQSIILLESALKR